MFRQLLVFTFLLLLAPSALAGDRLFFEADGVVYTGPGAKYRPLKSMRAGETLPVSRRQAASREGEEFFRVLVKSGGQSRVGYVSVHAAVRIEKGDATDRDEVDAHKPLELAQTAFQVGFHGFKDSNYIWTFGYLKYPTENFYIKGMVGQLLNRKSGNLLFGGEIGSDQSVWGQFSLYTLFAVGSFFLTEDNQVFEGSQKINYFAQGGSGVRYSADENAALSIGIFQVALLTPNNSLLSLGASLTLEVGL